MSRKKWTALEKPLSAPILDVIRKFNFDLMTPVQTATIPLLVSCKDVAAEAVTGSGKTLAFVVPMFELLLRRSRDHPWKKNEVGAIVISPTRELATQTSGVIKSFLEHTDLKQLAQQLIVGGNSVEEDVYKLKKECPVILICTPGRLEDLLKRKDEVNLAGRVKSLELLVLDEADRLLDLGFTNAINTILSYLPRQRRTGLFSATQTKEVTDLMRAGLRNPVLVSVKEKASTNTPLLLENFYMVVEPEQKLIQMLNFIKERDVKKAMLFYPTCACVEYWAGVLPQFLANKQILSLHGKMKKSRNKILEKFRTSDTALLLCTDVLARGVDIPEIDWVLQWDPPSNAAAFVHRVGRTARQGTAGQSLIMLLPHEDSYVEFLKRNQKVSMKMVPANDATEDLAKLNARIHKMQLTDRSMFDKANRAFVSHIRAYSKHECNVLLRMKDMPLGKVAVSYGLLRLPKMPEMKAEHEADFVGPTSAKAINFTDIRYKDKIREQSRQKKLEILEETGEWPGRKVHKRQTEAWELSKQKKEEQKLKKQQRHAKKELKKQSGGETAIKPSPKRKRGLDDEDIQELAKDIKLMKRLKKKQITEDEFDLEIGME